MDGISWTDLNSDERRAIAVLGAGASVGLCDAFALKTLRRVGLVTGSRLTRAAEQLRKAAVLQELAA
jgi:predicted NAD/FAD-binding protein